MSGAGKALEGMLGLLPGFDPWRDSEGYVFDSDRALKALVWWERFITHIEGEGIEGQSYELQPHEVCLLANIFGWVDPETGYRRFREVLYYVPRKNSKTTFAAGLMLLILFTDEAWKMQLYSCGSDADQAGILYEIMVAMCEANPELKKRVRVFRSPLKIVLQADKSTFRPLSAVGETKHGKNTHAVIYDEIHTYTKETLIEAIHTSMATRRQGLEVYTTTAAHVGENVCNRRYEYGCRVRDGVIRDARYLPAIYEVPEAVRQEDPDYWKKEEWWRYANPLFGLTVQKDFFEAEIRRAEIDPMVESSFKRLHLNVQTQSHETMIRAEKWALGDGDYCKDDFLGQTAVGAALDLGMVSDLCSLCLLFGNSGDGFAALWWHWIPQAAAEAYEKRNGIPFTEWARDGVVTITPGDEIDYERILFDIAGPEPGETDPKKKRMKGIGQRYVITTPKTRRSDGRGLAVDRLFQGAWLAQQLIKRKWNVVDFGQGFYSMSAPTKECLRLVGSGLLRHGNNPCVRWQSGNAVAEKDSAENIKPSKKSSEGKIDGIVTLIMAVGMALREEIAQGTVYEKRGFRVLEDPSRLSPRSRRGSRRVAFRFDSGDWDWIEAGERVGSWDLRFEAVLFAAGYWPRDYVVDPHDAGVYRVWRLEDMVFRGGGVVVPWPVMEVDGVLRKAG